MLSALHRTYDAAPGEKVNTLIEVAFAAASALIIALLVATALSDNTPSIYDAIVNFYAVCESHAFPLPGITDTITWLRFSTMDFFGSTVCCCGFRARLEQNKQRTPWFLALACCCLMQFGGTTLVGLLLGQPASWTTSPTACRSLLLAFWLTVSCPSDLFYRMYQHKIIKSMIAIGAALSTGHAVTSWGADKAINAIHPKPRSSVFSTLMAGAFGASGGGLSVHALDLWGERRRGKERSYAAFLFGAVASVSYYLMRNPHGVFEYEPLAPGRARLVIGALSLLSNAAPAVLGGHIAAATPPRVAEAAVRFVMRLPAHCGAAPPRAPSTRATKRD